MNVIKRFYLIVLCIIVLVIQNACNKKDEINIVNQSVNNGKVFYFSTFKVKILDNTLIFKNEQEYSNAIEFLANYFNNNFEKWEEKIGFISMRKSLYYENKRDELEFEDDLFLSLINPEGLIIIGNEKFKIDFNKRIAEVVDIKEKSTDKIKRYNFDYDYFTEKENAFKNTTEDYCPGDKIKYQTWNTSGGNVEWKMVYQKAVIYYSLQAKIKKDHFGGGEYIYISIGYYNIGIATNYKHKKTNCTAYNGYIGGGDEREYNLRAYGGSRRLQAYNFVASFWCDDYGATPSPIQYAVYGELRCDGNDSDLDCK